MTRELEDYEVYAHESDETGASFEDSIGSVLLPSEACWQDMPEELEINGFTYRKEA